MRVLEILAGLSFIAVWVFVLFKGIYKSVYLPKRYARDIEDKVRWIAVKNDRNDELFEYIEELQYELKVDGNYRIDFSSEKDIVCSILEEHRQSVIESYFFDSLKKDKARYTLNCLEYYICSLCGFLARHLTCDSNIVYYKLYYVVSLFCANNENVKPLFVNHTYVLNNIKNHIEKEVLNVQRNTTL